MPHEAVGTSMSGALLPVKVVTCNPTFAKNERSGVEGTEQIRIGLTPDLPFFHEGRVAT